MEHFPMANPTTVRTALITGASSGFGAAIARRLAPSLTGVILLARRREKLEALASELARPGLKVAVAAADIRDMVAVRGALKPHAGLLEQLDLLVNNAGLALGLEPAWETKLANWQQMVDTNVTSVLNLTREILPGMVARNRGHIINIGSVAGNYPYPGANVYGATKAFVRQFSLCLRADLLGKMIRVTNIEPGLAETEFSLVRFAGDADRASAVYQGTAPLTGEDVADAVAWCASLPEHVNINTVELMPTCQAFGGFAVHRAQP